jgi:hypothetical protein
MQNRGIVTRAHGQQRMLPQAREQPREKFYFHRLGTGTESEGFAVTAETQRATGATSILLLELALV